MKGPPWFWLIAGPNGAGKSTTARVFLPRLAEIVNPDEIAYRLSPDLPARSALRAGREAVELTLHLLAAREDFARETTLSGHSIISLLERAKTNGYRLGLIYIGLRSPELAIERVHRRRKQGGHDVPAADIRRRFHRSLANIAEIAARVDRTVFIDNSSTPARTRRIFEVAGGRVIYRQKTLPDWLRRGLRLGRYRLD